MELMVLRAGIQDEIRVASVQQLLLACKGLRLISFLVARIKGLMLGDVVDSSAMNATWLQRGLMWDAMNETCM